MLPAIFGENLFDEMFDDMMRPMHSMEKALYGKHARAIMKTDVRETDNSYEPLKHVDEQIPAQHNDQRRPDPLGYDFVVFHRGVQPPSGKSAASVLRRLRMFNYIIYVLAFARFFCAFFVVFAVFRRIFYDLRR